MSDLRGPLEGRASPAGGVGQALQSDRRQRQFSRIDQGQSVDGRLVPTPLTEGS